MNIKTKKYRLYNMQVRSKGAVTIHPIGANSFKEACDKLIKTGINERQILKDEA